MTYQYWILGAWIVIQGLYLSNAFERIAKLEAQLKTLTDEEIKTH